MIRFIMMRKTILYGHNTKRMWNSFQKKVPIWTINYFLNKSTLSPSQDLKWNSPYQIGAQVPDNMECPTLILRGPLGVWILISGIFIVTLDQGQWLQVMSPTGNAPGTIWLKNSLTYTLTQKKGNFIRVAFFGGRMYCTLFRNKIVLSFCPFCPIIARRRPWFMMA